MKDDKQADLSLGAFLQALAFLGLFLLALAIGGLIGLALLLLALFGGRDTKGEQKKTLADLERTRHKTRRESSAEKWGRK